MESENDKLYEMALDAITKLFSDHSVSQSKARENLQSLIDEIKIMMDTLEDDNDD